MLGCLPPRRNRTRGTVVIAFVATLILIFLFARDSHTYRDFLSYSTRPLWDSPDGPTTVLSHYYVEGVSPDDDAACSRHGWKPYRALHRQLVDVVLFSSELDLLEIRIRELWDVVDTFIVAESNFNLMGEPKNLTFEANQHRFAPWSSKIRHMRHEGRPMTSRDGPFTLVNEMRRSVNGFVHSELHLDDSSLILMSDVDEIPSRPAMKLLKSCLSPLPIHLQMQNYIYSFEWRTDARSWRAQLHSATDGMPYMHGKASEVMLADAGWHCSFCFRHLWEFAAKMRGASHADRLYHRLHWQNYIVPAKIQEKICQGEDLFDMLPEAFTWNELLRLWKGSSHSLSAVHLPRAVVHDVSKFRFLLPGGCLREA